MPKHKVFLSFKDEFLAGLASDLTRNNYLSDIRSLDQWFEPWVGIEDNLQIIKYVRWLEGLGLKTSTIRGRMVRIRRLYAFLIQKGYRRSDNPVNLSCLQKLKDLRTPRCPSYEELQRLVKTFDFSSLEGIRDATMTSFMLFEALRVNEVVELNLEDLEKINGHYRCLIKGKGGVLSDIYLWPQTEKILAKYLNVVRHAYMTSPLFFSSTKVGCQRLTTRGIRKRIDAMFKRAQIRQGFSCHSLRTAHASLLSAQGVPLAAIQKRLRHSSILTSLKYVKDEPSYYVNKRPEDVFPIKPDFQ